MKKKLGMGMKDLLQLTLDEDIRPRESGGEQKDKLIVDLRSEIKELKSQLKKNSGIKRKSHDAQAGKGADEILSGINKSRMNPDLIFEKGVKQLKKGNLITALELLNVVLYLDPAHIKALNNSAVILFELELNQEAREKLNMVLKIDPNNKTARENLLEIQKLE